MDANFEKCLDAVLQYEGGYVNDPDDPGGVTNLGVTIKTWSGWVGHQATVAEMKALTPEVVSPLYKLNYWDKVGCELWASGVDLMIFDVAVNMGPARAVRGLQRISGVKVDGTLGPATIAAAKAIEPTAMIEKAAALREQYYRSLKTFSKFGKGWLNRVANVKAEALKMAA